MEKKITDLNQINTDHTMEGRLLIAALSILTTEKFTNKTPNQVISILDELQAEIFKDNKGEIDDLPTIENLQLQAHGNAKAKGFHDSPVEFGTRIMLVVTELAEAVESHRKSYFAPKKDSTYTIHDVNAIDDEEHFTTFFGHMIKDTVEDELADAVIRILDLCGYYGIDLEAHILGKMRYNATRERLHGKKY